MSSSPSSGTARRRKLWLRVAGTLLLLSATTSVQGQGDIREYPPAAYYLSFEFFHDGDFLTAYKGFQSASKAGIRSTEGRWVDSICYHTMMGECSYQMGELRKAVDHYNRALSLFVTYQSWMIRVDFLPGIEPSRQARKPPNWGISTRGAVVGHFNKRYPILQGRFDNANVLVQGGVIALPEYIMINAHEIARCTALAIRRRRELMGSATKYDPLTGQVLQALSVRPARQNHWSQAWIDVQLGMAAAAAGKIQQAVTDLGNGAFAAGAFDHPLTAMALFELGKLAFEQEQYVSAGKFFHEASLSAAAFEQFSLIEESLRWGAKNHLATSQPGPYQSLSPAIGWARRESRYMEASLLVAAAENAAVLQETAMAVNLAEQARRRMARTEMLNGTVGAQRLAYVTSLMNYQTGKLRAGDQQFATLMGYQKRGSTRLYEIGLVDVMYNTGVVGERVAQQLYAGVLREPTGKDWATDPVETQTVLLAQIAVPLENWLNVTLKRREVESAIEITDRIRRHRFYTTLPMGGRLLSLRWVLDGPESALTERAVLQRQSLLEQFPRYAELAQRSTAVRRHLEAMPLVPEDPDARTSRQRWFQELDVISTEKEILLREIALRRAPAQMVFPPQLDFKQAQASLEDGQLVMSFLRTNRHVLAFTFGKDTYQEPWILAAPNQVEKELTLLLRDLGQVDRNQPVDVAGLGDDSWQEAANRLFSQVLNSKPLPEGLTELVVIPDGPLWYVPFEALPHAGGQPLISSVRVRYAPTVALAFPGARTARPLGETLVVAGRLFPRDDETVAKVAAEEIRSHLPRTTLLSESPQVSSSLLASLCDRLVVFTDIDDLGGGPYDWSPFQIDRVKSGSTLAHWMALPWGGPQQVILPGFHTAAEVGLRNGGTGDEIFLTLCGLMSTGARTVLISQWRTGGQSSYDLVREFVQELPYAPASDAWQRSVQLLMDSELVLEREPRVRFSTLERGIRGAHPFFWAGHLLVDTGLAPAVPEAVAEVEEGSP